MGDGHMPAGEGEQQRLGVAVGTRAGGGVAGVPDGDATANPVQAALVEDLVDEPEPGVAHESLAVGGDDAGRLLTPVLQTVQAQVRQVDRILVPPDAE